MRFQVILSLSLFALASAIPITSGIKPRYDPGKITQAGDDGQETVEILGKSPEGRQWLPPVTGQVIGSVEGAVLQRPDSAPSQPNPGPTDAEKANGKDQQGYEDAGADQAEKTSVYTLGNSSPTDIEASRAIGSKEGDVGYAGGVAVDAAADTTNQVAGTNF